MLVIYAHPHKQGYNGYILKIVESVLNNKNVQYEILDLYQDEFDPLLDKNEVDKHGGDSSQINKYQQQITNTEKMVIIYPNWWNNCPAILKGFLDRVLAAGFAFKYINGLPKPLLSGQALVFNTSGAPWLYQKIIAGNRSLKVVVKDTLKFCGIDAKGVLFGNCRHLKNNKEKLKKRVTKELNQLIDS